MSSNDATHHKGGEPLLSEFAAPSLAEWQLECERLLKGAPFAKKMFTRTLEGFIVNPMYTAADTADLPWLESAPGEAPFVRGAQSADSGCWLVAQELPYPTVEEFNNALRADLKRGQTAVNLLLDEAGHRGLDPDQAPVGVVGLGGTSLASVSELATALDGVDLSVTPLLAQAGSAALPLAAMLLAMLRKQGKDAAELKGCLGSDPVYGLARDGKLPLALERLYDELAALTRWAESTAPALKTIPVWEAPWHDGGADCALGLGLSLAGAVEHLRQLEARGVDVDTAARRFQFNLSIGSDFFMEIAKVRALRLLWSNVCTEVGCPAAAAEVTVHGRTSRRTLSRLDAHVNMLRVTTQAMSAVLGGVDSLHVSPFDEMDSLPDEFSRRIARNVQLVLAHECHFDHVVDPAGGSWYVEKLTDDLARAAWQVVNEIETAGGIVAALEAGLVQKRVKEAARLRTERLAVRKDVLIGTNQYANLNEPGRERRQPDFGGLHTRRTVALEHLRTSALTEDHMLVLGDLEKILDSAPEHWLEHMIEAADRGATLGELTEILRHDAEPIRQVEAIPLRRDAEPFEELRATVDSLREADPACGRVFTVCLGDFARYMPRLEFTRRFFQVGGFEMAGDEYFTDAATAAAAVAGGGAATAVLVGLDETYAELAVEVVRKLLSAAPELTIMVAGQPAAVLEALKSGGVVEFIHVRSDVLAVLGRLAKTKGVQS